MNLNVQLLPWQKKVWASPSRFKVIAAGRRCGKTHYVAWRLIVEALASTSGAVWYVAPTQQQARDIIWMKLLDLAKDVITHSHINNMQITLINGSVISLKGADRPETMRGVALKFVALDEYADMRVNVWEQILRPALADHEGHAVFIGTPKGRNHFFDLFEYADSGVDPEWAAWHFTSYDNPLLKPSEIEAAKKSMSSFAFRQEFMASFEAAASDVFKPDWWKIEDTEPEDGEYHIAVDLAGFEDVSKEASNKKKHLDETAICVAKVSHNGWWVKEIIHGRWDVRETAVRIIKAARDAKVGVIGIEKGALKNALIIYLKEQMQRMRYYCSIIELTHGNKKKTDRIVWSLQGRMEHGRIKFNRGEWNKVLFDQMMQFPDSRTHDDLLDSLSYIDQVSIMPMLLDEAVDEYEPLDQLTGY
jgi:phage terminase large subunit-like protein